MTIKDLLRDVKSPDYSLPDVEQDVVVFGIIAKRSEPRAHKPTEGKRQSDREKYMVITLVDLQFEVELYLFNSGFTRFWKITEGTVVAILNPGVMPPPPGRLDTGRFSLTINSDADTILEIGTARDLSFCKSVKKDGNLCSSWVNRKRTEFCEYHTNEAVRKQRSSRLELNQNNFGGGPKKRWTRSHDVHKEQSTAYNQETHSHWYVSKSLSTADLIDGVDNRDGGIADRREKEEALKKRLAAKEKEVEMMKKLGNIGDGAGRDYLRCIGAKASSKLGSSASSTLVSNSSSLTDDKSTPLDAKALGLLGPRTKDQAIHLSPVKRKRPESSQSSSTAATSSLSKSGLGWGGNLKDKLARMKDGEKLTRPDRSPVRKKTRFVTEKGIREAGRESLGDELSAGKNRRAILEQEDEDELVIVR